MANKTQKTIKLAGYTSKGIKAKTHNAAEVVMFRNEKNSIQVRVSTSVENAVAVTTTQGTYTLIKHATIDNLYAGKVANGIKAHFTKKKIVAKLIYWA